MDTIVQAKRVLEIFKEMSQIPRGSGNEKGISDSADSLHGAGSAERLRKHRVARAGIPRGGNRRRNKNHCSRFHRKERQL